MRQGGHIYTPAEFLELCAEVEANGRYIRAVDVVGVSGYRVKPKDILPRRDLNTAARGLNRYQHPAISVPKCEPAVAQLWFDVLNAV